MPPCASARARPRDGTQQLSGVARLILTSAPQTPGVLDTLKCLERARCARAARVANDLKMLIESANAPIFGIDTRGLINEWNKKVAEITGYTADEMLGQLGCAVVVGAISMSSTTRTFARCATR